jgi:hypothetical protein
MMLTMNRKQWLLTGCYVLMPGGSVLFSIRGIKFSSHGGSFTAPHLNLALLFVENAALAIIYSAFWHLFRRHP